MSYIERETALQIIDNYAKAVSEDGKVVVDAIRDIVEVITPTADVAEVRHGKWIEQVREYEKYWVTEGFKCSICGFELTDNDYKYCPECGAKMSDVIERSNENAE